MNKNKKVSGLVVSKKQQQTLSRQSSGKGGSNMVVLTYMLSLATNDRLNGMTAKQLGDNIAKDFGVALNGSQIRGFFRTHFAVGVPTKDSQGNTKADSKYKEFGQTNIGGNEYVATGTGSPMTYSILTTQDEIDANIS